MTKFLIILLLIICGILIGVSYIKKLVQSFLSGFTQVPPLKKKAPAKTEPLNEVIYDRDNIVVLKGEAKRMKSE